MALDEKMREVFRPENVHMGTMKVDAAKCTGCGLCVLNCLFRTWEMGDDNIPRYKEGGACFSCYNCLVACPVDAISVDQPYHVDSGFWATEPQNMPSVRPMRPLDADGNPDEWTEVERVVFTRRSVRNFSDRPVSEHLIRRILEAGRHAPSGGNSQPWKFIVITNKALIDRMNEATAATMLGLFGAYSSDEGVEALAAGFSPAAPGGYDPRIILGGVGTNIRNRINPALLGAPVVILLAGDRRAIGGPQTQIAIAGTNMNLVANSLGLKGTWVGFVAACNGDAEIMSILGLKDPFSIITSVVFGYPKFKQEGTVPREFRPITWFREGVEAPEIEATPPLPEVTK
jgi:nitroreductase/NAD-dependent dihydropyrimidine dehydrogenase PreA subunit